MIKAVIFDLDGTLCYTLRDLANAVNYAVAEFGGEPYELDSFNMMVGDGMPVLIKRALPHLSDADRKKALKLFKKHYAEHCLDNTYIYDGIADCLSALRADGIKTAVFTNKDQSFAETIVRELIKVRFDMILGGKPSLPKKPEPEGAFMIARKLRVNTDECIIVGDSSNDMQTACACGSVGLGVLWGYRSREELIRSGARFLCDKPEDIVRIIREINS